MPKTHPVSIASERHGLAGNLVLPEGAAKASPTPGAVIIGGPGPVPLSRYTGTGARQWPVLWTESLAEAGIAGLCYDQCGAGLSSGQYHEATWEDLLEDARAAVETLSLQPEVGPVAAIAWAEGCAFALQLAAEHKVQALVLLAPAYLTAEERYSRGVAALAARNGLSNRVVELRIRQWRQEIERSMERVHTGETYTTMEMGGGQQVRVNQVRFLQTVAFNPAAMVEQVQVPTLLLHGEDDTAISPEESGAMAAAMPDRALLITYPGVAHFIYRHPMAIKDATGWIRRTLC